MAIDWLAADWPAPDGVHAGISLRGGGVSTGPYASLNLGDRCGDAPVAVAENRRRLRQGLQLPAEPAWLRQVHGRRVVCADAQTAPTPEADASWTARHGVVCAVLSADCLPVLLCSDDAQIISAVHAGWRGLAAGVIEAAVGALPVPPAQLLAWIGPAIGPGAFEVGAEVRAAFCAQDAGAAAHFAPGPTGKWFADLPALARRRLEALGVAHVTHSGRCTYSEPQHFFSHRRDGPCGRQAALIWRNA